MVELPSLGHLAWNDPEYEKKRKKKKVKPQMYLNLDISHRFGSPLNHEHTVAALFNEKYAHSASLHCGRPPSGLYMPRQHAGDIVNDFPLS